MLPFKFVMVIPEALLWEIFRFFLGGARIGFNVEDAAVPSFLLLFHIALEYREFTMNEVQSSE